MALKRVFTPEKDRQLLALVAQGVSRSELCRVFDVTHPSLIARLRKLGVPIKTRPKQLWDSANDAELLRCYTELGMGVLRCANHFGTTYRVVERAVRRLGVLDSSRQHQRGLGWREGQRRRKPYRFTTSVIQQVYARDGYLCQWCKKPTTPEDRCVHHKVPVDEAIALGWTPTQTRAVSNGVTLHRSCHTDPKVFPLLHNGRAYRYALQMAHTPQTRCACGARKLLKGDTCFECGVRVGSLTPAQLKGGRLRRRLRPTCTSCTTPIKGKDFNGRCRVCTVAFVAASNASASELVGLVGASLVCVYRLMREAGVHPRG